MSYKNTSKERAENTNAKPAEHPRVKNSFPVLSGVPFEFVGETSNLSEELSDFSVSFADAMFDAGILPDFEKFARAVLSEFDANFDGYLGDSHSAAFGIFRVRFFRYMETEMNHETKTLAAERFAGAVRALVVEAPGHPCSAFFLLFELCSGVLRGLNILERDDEISTPVLEACLEAESYASENLSKSTKARFPVVDGGCACAVLGFTDGASKTLLVKAADVLGHRRGGGTRAKEFLGGGKHSQDVRNAYWNALSENARTNGGWRELRMAVKNISSDMSESDGAELALSTLEAACGVEDAEVRSRIGLLCAGILCARATRSMSHRVTDNASGVSSTRPGGLSSDDVFRSIGAGGKCGVLGRLLTSGTVRLDDVLGFPSTERFEIFFSCANAEAEEEKTPGENDECLFYRVLADDAEKLFGCGRAETEKRIGEHARLLGFVRGGVTDICGEAARYAGVVAALCGEDGESDDGVPDGI